MSKKTYKPGDYFSFPINNKEFGFGRILLAPFLQGVQKGKIDKNNPLYFADDVIMVMLYKNTSESKTKLPKNLSVLIPSIFTPDGFITSGLWPILDHKKVEPTKIDFPEFVSQKGPRTSMFIKGEFRVEIDMKFQDAADIKMPPTTYPGVIFGQLILYNTGREDEINVPNLNKSLRSTSNLDLRFSEKRKSILDLVPKKLLEDYHGYAKDAGKELKRLFE